MELNYILIFFSVSFISCAWKANKTKQKIPKSSSRLKMLEDFKWCVGLICVPMSVDGCLCTCRPEVNWQLIEGVTCPRPAIAGCCLQHVTIPNAGWR